MASSFTRQHYSQCQANAAGSPGPRIRHFYVTPLRRQAQQAKKIPRFAEEN